jgi:hypothetical protein
MTFDLNTIMFIYLFRVLTDSHKYIKRENKTHWQANRLGSTNLDCSDKKPRFEFYLGEDILQGEKVPFYLLWKDNTIDRICMQYNGFKSIIRLFNVKEYEKIDGGVIVRKEALKSPGYLGGVLSTALATVLTESPARPAKLVLNIECSNGTSITLNEERILHSARAFLVNQPTAISVPIKKGQECIKINIEGAASVSIDISPSKGGLELGFPQEVLTAVERFAYAAVEGMKTLRKEYPQHSELLSLLTLDSHENQSFTQLIHTIQRKLEKAKKDKSFAEALSYVYISALIEQEKVKDSLLIPMLEYLESGATTKAFLNSPFLCAKVPKGGGMLKCTLRFYDILRHNCAKTLIIKTSLEAAEDTLVPLKELIQFSRGSSKDVSKRC